jgi:hypothetical protein
MAGHRWDGLRPVAEETLDAEGFMWIDIATLWEDVIAWSGFAGCLLLTVCVGVLGPSAITRRDVSNLYGNHTFRSFFIEVDGVSPANRFIAIEVSFILRRPRPGHLPPVSFAYRYDVSTRTNSWLRYSANYHLENLTRVIPPNKQTNRLRILRDDDIDYQIAEFTISVRHIDLVTYRGLTIHVAMVSRDHILYQSWFRFAYSAFEVVALVLLLRRRRLGAFSFEQRLCVPLLICAVASNTPLYFWYIGAYPRVLRSREALTDPLFHSLAAFAALTFLDLPAGYEPANVVFLFCDYVTESLAAWQSAVPALWRVRLVSNLWSVRLRMSRLALHAVFLAWIQIKMGRTALRADDTERFKVAAYFVAAALFGVFVRALPAMGIAFGTFEWNETEWVVTFAGANIFVLAMTYFHWPYEFRNDLQYNGASIGAQSLMVDELTDDIDFDVLD